MKNKVIKELVELSKLGIDVKSAIKNVKDGLFDDDLKDFSDSCVRTSEATDLVIELS